MHTQLLTTNWSGVLEDLKDFRIHLDIEVLLLSQLLCSFSHFSINPVSKVFTSNSINDICYVLAMEILNLSLFLRQNPVHSCERVCKLKHLLNWEWWKVWNMNKFHILRLDVLSISTDDVFQMIDRHCFVSVQINLALRCKKPEAFLLWGESLRKFRACYSNFSLISISYTISICHIAFFNFFDLIIIALHSVHT